jgi:hypothetical protein
MGALRDTCSNRMSSVLPSQNSTLTLFWQYRGVYVDKRRVWSGVSETLNAPRMWMGRRTAENMHRYTPPFRTRQENVNAVAFLISDDLRIVTAGGQVIETRGT